MSGMLAAVAVVSLGQFQYLGHAYESQSPERLIAAPSPVVYNRAMNWSGVEQVGREWQGRTIVGGRAQQMPLAWGRPGPAAYGADEHDFRTLPARVGNVQVAVSPWVEIPRHGSLGRMERARQLWLREQGYVGGTRVFRNPVYDRPAEHAKADRDETRWHIIQVPVRRAPRFEVRAEPAEGVTLVTLGEPASSPVVASDRERRVVTAPAQQDRRVAKAD